MTLLYFVSRVFKYCCGYNDLNLNESRAYWFWASDEGENTI